MESQINEVVNSIRRAALRQEEGELTDGQLLSSFIERRDQAAVTALVQRHGLMVWGVCRRILRHHHDAEDAFQATFLVLVRKAVSIRQREMMANWLYGVAHQTAMKARALLAKRRTREKQGTAMPQPQAPEQDTGNDLQALLDQELSRLPEKYRVAIVLCDLEGKTRQQAARQLALPEGTMAGRLTRGRAMMARRLAQRGLAVSGGALAAVFSQEAASAGLPIAVVAATIKAASMFAAGRVAAAGAISVPVAALTEGVLKAMLLAKLRIPLLVIVTLALAGTGGVAHHLVQARAAEAVGTVEPSPNQDSPEPGGQAAAPKQDLDRRLREKEKQMQVAQKAALSQEFLNEALKEFEAAAGDQEYRLLADMAGLQTQLGDRDAAKKMFERASDLISATNKAYGYAGEGWDWLAVAVAHAGDVDQAIAAASRIPQGKERDSAFQQVARALAHKRLENEALRVAAMVEDRDKKARLGSWLLEDLAVAHVAAGNIPQALDIVERMKDPSSQVTALLGGRGFQPSWGECPFDPGVALAQAKAGDKALAKKTLERAAKLVAAMPRGKAPDRPRALTTLACVQARLDEFAAARKTMEEIQHENGKINSLATLVRQLARAGRTREAMTEIDPLPAGTTKVYALMHFGAGQAEAGDQKAARASFEQAYQLIGELGKPGVGIDLATIRANVGDYKGALQTADTYFPNNDLGYANIAFAQARAGDFKGALATAAKIKDGPNQGPGWWKLNILRHTAACQAKRGESSAVVESIRLDSHLARANALMGLAEGLATLLTEGQVPEDEKENQAVEAVRKYGGEVLRDKEKPGMPVVAVNFVTPGVTDEQLNVLMPLKNLTSLDLDGSKVTDAGLKAIAPIKQLTTIHLRFTQVSDMGLKELASLTSLTDLDVSGTKVTDAGLRDIGHLKGLMNLGLGDTRVTDEGLKELAHLRGLTRLVLYKTTVTGKGLQELAQLTKLQFLTLQGVPVTDLDLKELAPFKELTTLFLQQTQVTDRGLRELAPLKSLVTLHLDKTQVTDVGLKELVSLKQLRSLSLYDTKVTDAGLKDLASLKALSSLTLTHTGVTDDGLKHFVDLKSLTTLDLNETKVTGEGVAMLRKALPKCKIYHGDTLQPRSSG
jgi:RNA polymerase sigma factor (sigma-70 family)